MDNWIYAELKNKRQIINDVITGQFISKQKSANYVQYFFQSKPNQSNEPGDIVKTRQAVHTEQVIPTYKLFINQSHGARHHCFLNKLMVRNLGFSLQIVEEDAGSRREKFIHFRVLDLN